MINYSGLHSLRTIIVFIFIAVISFFILGLTILSNKIAKNDLESIYLERAREYQKLAISQVEAYNTSTIKHRSDMIEERKNDMTESLEIVFDILEYYNDQVLSGKISLKEAQSDALKNIKSIRYDNSDGFIWVTDIAKPVPSMVMHPIATNLNGQVLDAPVFNCIKGSDENLYKTFLEICLKYGSGYIEHDSPRPSNGDLTPFGEISYARIYTPWNWMFATGLYVDDIYEEAERRIKAAVEELNSTIVKHGIGANGYTFIFDSDNKMIVHPKLEGSDISKLVAPDTGRTLDAEMRDAAENEKEALEYVWYNNSSEDQHLVKKAVYVKFYAPLKWYIGTSIDIDYINQQVFSFSKRLAVFFIFALILTVVFSLIVSSSITTPLKSLVDSITQTDSEGIPVGSIPDLQTYEIEKVASAMSKILVTIRDSRHRLLVYKEHLEELISYRTQELKSALEELHETQAQIVESEKMASLGSLVTGVANEITIPINQGVKAASNLNESAILFNKKFEENNLTFDDFDDFISIALINSDMMLALMRTAAEQIKSFKLVAVDQTNDVIRNIKLKEYIHDILVSIRSELKKYKHTIDIECDASLEVVIYPGALAQIIENLVMNSIIHGFENIEIGHIEIKVYKESDQIKIVFADNGTGMEAAELLHIFDAFYTSKKDQGRSGLGMNIVYNLVTTKLKGQIICKKNTPQGLLYEITFKDIA
ncbi:MAG: cache domain-containing protein [Spirochaetales bacterium]|nr:cache domain-containing protein [Spirochaetales bacterium]